MAERGALHLGQLDLGERSVVRLGILQLMLPRSSSMHRHSGRADGLGRGCARLPSLGTHAIHGASAHSLHTWRPRRTEWSERRGVPKVRWRACIASSNCSRADAPTAGSLRCSGWLARRSSPSLVPAEHLREVADQLPATTPILGSTKRWLSARRSHDNPSPPDRALGAFGYPHADFVSHNPPDSDIVDRASTVR